MSPVALVAKRNLKRVLAINLVFVVIFSHQHEQISIAPHSNSRRICHHYFEERKQMLKIVHIVHGQIDLGILEATGVDLRSYKELMGVTNDRSKGVEIQQAIARTVDKWLKHSCQIILIQN